MMDTIMQRAQQTMVISHVNDFSDENARENQSFFNDASLQNEK